jgi:hypothetical protein
MLGRMWRISAVDAKLAVSVVSVPGGLQLQSSKVSLLL